MDMVVGCVVIALVLLGLLIQIGGFKASGDVLADSFAGQTALVDGQSLPTSQLRVLHRWPSSSIRSRYGQLMQIDANWLCQTVDGQYVLGIAQGLRSASDWTFTFWRDQPIAITWIWRNLSEMQVRHMLAADRAVYGRIFGTGVPGAPG